MSDGSETNIENALLTRVAGLDFDQAQIAWPNMSFTPKTGTAWIRPNVLPAETQSPGLANVDANRHLGVLQISLFWPTSKTGSLEPQREADKILSHFAKGTRMTKGDVTVYVWKAPWREVPQTEPDWYHIPLRVPYRADV